MQQYRKLIAEKSFTSQVVIPAKNRSHTPHYYHANAAFAMFERKKLGQWLLDF